MMLSCKHDRDCILDICACTRMMFMSKKYNTVTPGLSDTGLSENLIYPTLHWESPSPLCVQFTLIYPTPGLSDTFYEEQTWSDKPGPTVYYL